MDGTGAFRLHTSSAMCQYLQFPQTLSIFSLINLIQPFGQQRIDQAGARQFHAHLLAAPLSLGLDALKERSRDSQARGGDRLFR